MATYTETLRNVLVRHDVESLALSQYPIFDEGHRKALNDKIIGHYYMREIGFETVDLFLYHLKRRMIEIMPYYNQLYESELIKYDPLKSVDISSIDDSASNSSDSSKQVADTTGKSGSTSRSVDSSFPQTQLSTTGDYATAGNDASSRTETSSTNSTAGESSTNSTTKAAHRQSGRMATGQQLITELRQTFLNVDMMVVDDVGDLFMGVWDNSDYHSNTNCTNFFYPAFYNYYY